MDNQIRLDYEKASAQARLVQGDAEAIESILNDLVEEVEANINNENVWKGASAKDFKDTWDKYAENFSSFVSHVKSIQEKIDYTANQVSTFDTSGNK